MNPQEYESYVASVYENEGYQVTVTPYIGDGGIDVVAEKDGKRIAVQCKHYGNTSRSVNSSMIRNIYAASVENDCDEAHLVTDGRLLPDADKTAEKLEVRVRYISSSLYDENDRIPKDNSLNKGPQDDRVTGKETATQNLEIIQILEKVGTFDVVWARIKKLVGQKIPLLKETNEFNIITKVDNAGLKRISKNNRESKSYVPIEVFRYAYNRLMQSETMSVTRSEVNAEYPDYCSSIVVAVLAKVLPVKVSFSPITLKLNI